jgi:glucose/arabinose dehydrogenase
VIGADVFRQRLTCSDAIEHPAYGHTIDINRRDTEANDAARDILTGFLAPDERESYGRPVGVAIGPDRSSLLVADDVGDEIWRLTGARA